MAEKHFNVAGTHVLVSNPETDGRWECPVDYLPVALRRGWELAEPVEDPIEGEAPVRARSTKKTASKTPGD